MGAITDDKKIYDQYAVDYFKQRGWKAFPVAKTGRYADVVALRGKDLAIVEVKSPKETSAVKTYDDSANLSARLEREIGGYLKETRQKVFDLFPETGKSIHKLYAVTIASQIYRYLYEFDERVGEYERAVNGGLRLNGNRLNKFTYLIVPSENSSEPREALDCLRKNHYVYSYTLDPAGKIVVLNFSYRG